MGINAAKTFAWTMIDPKDLSKREQYKAECARFHAMASRLAKYLHAHVKTVLIIFRLTEGQPDQRVALQHNYNEVEECVTFLQNRKTVNEGDLIDKDWSPGLARAAAERHRSAEEPSPPGLVDCSATAL